MNIEIVGQSQNIQAEANQWVYQNAREMKRILDCVTIPSENVNTEITRLEKQLHVKNRNRCEYYDLRYIRPNVIYINTQIYNENLAQINHELSNYEGADFSLLPKKFGGYFRDDANTIVLPVDNDTDQFKQAFLQLRHEMAHAGSIRKLRIYGQEKNRYFIGCYRSGAVVRSHNDFEIGIALNEGHNLVEDLMFTGLYSDKYNYWKANRFMQEREMLSKKHKLIGLGGEPTWGYGDFRRLIIKIYDMDTELYRLAEDFIYGDRMISFAKRLDQVFGKGFFSKLMEIRSGDEAKGLLQEIS